MFSDGGKARGRCIAFDADMSVVSTFKPNGEAFANTGELGIAAFGTDGKQVWATGPQELIVDDLLLTPKYVYCVGHYLRIQKVPELRVMSRQDGQVLQTLTLEDMPSHFGMSAGGNRLLVATRQGGLMCFTEDRK